LQTRSFGRPGAPASAHRGAIAMPQTQGTIHAVDEVFKVRTPK
jgi:hypothetical protein